MILWLYRSASLTPFVLMEHTIVPARAYRLYEKRACNLHSDCTVGKILIVAKINDKCVGRAEWKPVNASQVLVGVSGECF